MLIIRTTPVLRTEVRNLKALVTKDELILYHRTRQGWLLVHVWVTVQTILLKVEESHRLDIVFTARKHGSA